MTIRPTATTDIEIADTDSIDAFNAAVTAALPDGHDLVKADLKTGIATIRPRETKDITIADRSELGTCAPDGWMALSIRKA